MDVKYPKNRARFGVIKVVHGKLIFRCHDSKFVDMIVRDMERKPFHEIRDEFFPNFSMIKLSRIDPQYFEKYYFKAELTEWSMYEKNPYCIITKIVGRVIDPVVIPTIYEID